MDLTAWTSALLDAADREFTTLIACVPPNQRQRIGELKNWSPKDQMAHLVYWLELYAKNLQARREGREPEDIRNYQERNDAAWHERREWTWDHLAEAWQTALQAVAAEFGRLPEPQQRAQMRSLIYELVDHPHHHYVRLYAKLGKPKQARALLARTEALLAQRGAARWTAATRRKLQGWALELT